METNKKLSFAIQEKDFVFRSLKEADVTEAYVHALKKQKSYLTNNPDNITVQWQQEYIRKIIASPFDAIFGTNTS